MKKLNLKEAKDIAVRYINCNNQDVSDCGESCKGCPNKVKEGEVMRLMHFLIDQNNGERPEWCNVGSTFEWEAPSVTGFESITEDIIGYTDRGFLHTAPFCPVYETLYTDLTSGRIVIKET